MKKSENVYMTTFCNNGHDTVTGRPIGHECVRLNPESLQHEMSGDFDMAIMVGVTYEDKKRIARHGKNAMAND